MANEPDKVNSGAIAVMIVMVALTTAVVAMVVEALVRKETARLQSEGDLAQERPLRQLRAEQDGKLNASAAWADKEAGVARVPLSSAMAMVLEAIRENPLAFSPGNEPKEETEDPELEDEPEEETSEEGADTGSVEPGPSLDGAVPSEAQPIAPSPTPAPQSTPAPKAPAPTPTAPAPTAPAPAPTTPKGAETE